MTSTCSRLHPDAELPSHQPARPRQRVVRAVMRRDPPPSIVTYLDLLKGAPVTGPISNNRLIESLKEAASWPGADRNTLMILALTLVSARADAEGSSYFQDLSEGNPADPTAQALAGFFQVRAGHDVAAAEANLD